MSHLASAPVSRVAAAVAARVLVAFAAGAAILVLTAAPAAAHVEVDSTDAVPGGMATLRFHVPTESETASTVGLQVQLPTGYPLTNVTPQSPPGWTSAVTPATGSEPGSITWTAGSADASVKPGNSAEFVVVVGPLPAVDTLTFKAVQLYDNGEVVRWIDPPLPGGAEPEHPAPALTLARAGAEPVASGTESTAGPSTTAGAPALEDQAGGEAPAADRAGSLTAYWPVGLAVIAVLGTAVLVALRWRPRRTHDE